MFVSREFSNWFFLRRKSDKFAVLSLIFLTVCILSPPSEAKYGGGAGEPNDSYQIWTAEQMNTIGAEPNDWDKHFKLMADIDLSQYTGEQFNIIGYFISYSDNKPFTGVFDGNGKAISNFTYRSRDRDRIGLFGNVGKYGKYPLIKNLGLIGPNIDVGKGNCVGALIGLANNTTIEGCWVEDGSIYGELDVGGLIGYSVDSTISSCYSTVNVQGTNRVGGLAGWANSVTFLQCHSNSVVIGKSGVGGLLGGGGTKFDFCHSTGEILGENSVGGLVGSNSATITSCFSTATVICTDGSAGGLIGYNGGLLTSCRASGNVEGNDSVGGLAGYNSNYQTITHCYATGAVHGDKAVAGLVGNNNGRIRFSYSTGQVTGSESVAGLTNGDSVYLCYWDNETSGVVQSAAGKGRTTAKMQSASTYTGWGYESQWKLDEGKDYPRLIWEDTPGELLIDKPHSYGGGTGEPDNPYQLHTAQQLVSIAYYPEDFDKHFILTDNIDLGTIDPNEIIPIGTRASGFPFSGSLAGNWHTISNLTCHEDGQNYIGLFGVIGQDGYVEEVRLENTSVFGSSCIGGLAGGNSGVIHQCFVIGIVEGKDNVGGLVGSNGGSITRCLADGQIIGNRYVGGLAGYNGSYIVDCYNTGTVTGYQDVGGLVGTNGYPSYPPAGQAGLPPGVIPYPPKTNISSCYNAGYVEGHSSVGGLIGRNAGLITTCYAAGAVIGVTDIVDRRYWGGGIIEEEAIAIGGLVGSSEFGVSLLSYWDMETTGLSESAEGRGKTTEQMTAARTFRGWGYLDQWVIDEGSDYPHLIWESLQGELLAGDPDRYSGGSGEPNDPYRISTRDDLVDLSNYPVDWNRCFVMTDDIDFNDLDPNQIQPVGVYGVPFVGIFDGNDHTILNFKYVSDTESFLGIFGSIGPEVSYGQYTVTPQEPNIAGSVVNLNVENVEILAYCCAGGLAGYNGGIIFNCSVTGNVEAILMDAGGLLGYNVGEIIIKCDAKCSVKSEEVAGGLIACNSGPVTACSFSGSVEAEETNSRHSAGGLIGANYHTVKSCHSNSSITGGYNTGGLIGYSTGTVIDSSASGSITGTRNVGGLIGQNRFQSPITRCVSDCIVTGDDTVGGLVGYNGGEISCCYTKGHVNGTKDAAGLVGRNYENILFCYSSCTVSGQEGIAGLVSDSSFRDITSCFWDKDVSGLTDGVANRDPDPEGAVGLSTSQMQTAGTFLYAGWDFIGETENGTEDIWWILEGQDYPRLWWEGSN